jgi:hypothetical protein
MNNENFLNKLTEAENLILLCKNEEKVFEGLNILEEILMNITNSIENNYKITVIINKLIDCFCKVNNQTKICILNLIKNYNKKLFSENIFIKKDVEKKNKHLIIIIKYSSDPMERRIALNLIYEFNFLINLELIHNIFNLYNSEIYILTKDEKIIIEKIFKIIINNNLNYKQNVLNFLNLYNIKLN